MRVLRIYRVETQTGIGMYNCGFTYQIPSGMEAFLQCHPHPQSEGVDPGSYKDEWRDIRFGFSTIEQLRAWFDYDNLVETLDDWIGKGGERLQVSIYEVSRDFAISTYSQCFFDRSEARLIERRALKELMEYQL